MRAQPTEGHNRGSETCSRDTASVHPLLLENMGIIDLPRRCEAELCWVNADFDDFYCHAWRIGCRTEAMNSAIGVQVRRRGLVDAHLSYCT